MNTYKTRSSVKIDLADVALFGNDAADLEHEAIFFSYAVERTELSDLVSPDNTIQVIRAYKGEGKSALLRLARSHLARLGTNQLVIPAIGPDHSPFVECHCEERCDAAIHPKAHDIATKRWIASLRSQ